MHHQKVCAISLLGLIILTDCSRYPDDVNFNPQLKKWKCPFCRDTCNCTKCCFKRNVRYTSTANVRIDQDTLLYYASLMPGKPKSKKQPPLRKPSTPAKKSNSAKKSKSKTARGHVKRPTTENVPAPGPLETAATRDIESVIRGLADTAAMFEKFGCVSGEYWGVVFSNVDGGRIGVAYVGDKLPDIFFLKDDNDDGRAEELPPPAKRLRVSSRASS